ncbi:uncharacterized protein LOC131648590 [Vicia villosa]|uniref:uncharacterized protein LOC131648590 n=1 Tax=Vicia villosa TaxID=3911 RepID=UPI00273C41B1|nr:uncharacterized protein LOC131648590 [Vicia villosa]
MDVGHQQVPMDLYNPPLHMRNVSLDEEDDGSIFETPVPMQTEGGLFGMKFASKEECVFAIAQYHIKHSLDYEVYKSDSKRYIVKCKNEECTFRCRGTLGKISGTWKITKVSGQHTCTSVAITQDHKKLNSNIISDSIKRLIQEDASLKVKHIIAHICEKFNYTISYKKAWIAKNKAIASTFGNWETSYNDLPQWLLVMKYYLPGVVVDLETLPALSDDGTQIDGCRIFHRLFWAFQPCIKGFAYCKPVVQVDGTWLYGKYKGTLLLAVAQDGNRNIFPIAFALVEGETGDAWSFFLRNLRMHVTPQPNICLISDRHVSIKSAYDNPENGWQCPPSTHVYCIRNIAQNFMREIRDKELHKKVINMGYALTESTYNYYRGEIRMSNMDAYNWVENIPREKWCRAFDGGQRWGHMTTNLAESMNSVLKATRNLPVTALVRSTYFRMGELFGRRGHEWTKKVGSGQQYTKSCLKGIEEEAAKASSHHVRQFDRLRFCFLVEETMNHNECRPTRHFNVDLKNQTCECGKFQTFHVPCSHVIAACASIHHDYTVHIADVFKVVNVFKVYEESFIGVGTEADWPRYEGDTLCHNDAMRRRKKGRPNSTRIRTEMDDYEKEKRRCGICREFGHYRKTCPNRAGPSS